MCVSSQKHRMKKEEGTTVGVCRPFCLPYLLSAGRFVVSSTGRTGSVSTETTLQEAPIKYHKCPTFDAKRDFQTIKTKMQMSLRTD